MTRADQAGRLWVVLLVAVLALFAVATLSRWAREDFRPAEPAPSTTVTGTTSP